MWSLKQISDRLIKDDEIDLGQSNNNNSSDSKFQYKQIDDLLAAALLELNHS